MASDPSIAGDIVLKAAQPPRSRVVRRFMEDVVHELRTPLAALTMVGENALARPTNEARLRADVDSMLEEAQRLRELLGSLLGLARGASAAAAAHEWVDAALLARQCLRTVRPLAKARGQRLELLAYEDLWLRGDPVRLRQALLNLVHNAIVHCGNGAWIQVRVAAQGDGLLAISVRDDGPGIGAAQQAGLFRRCARGARDDGHAGLGLGLAIAMDVARAHGGGIHLDSRPGHGSCFTLKLPRSPRAALPASAPLPLRHAA